MKRGKKYVEAAKLVDRATLYDVNEAVSIVKKASSAKFDETVESEVPVNILLINWLHCQ